MNSLHLRNEVQKNGLYVKCIPLKGSRSSCSCSK